MAGGAGPSRSVTQSRAPTLALNLPIWAEQEDRDFGSRQRSPRRGDEIAIAPGVGKDEQRLPMGLGLTEHQRREYSLGVPVPGLSAGAAALGLARPRVILVAGGRVPLHLRSKEALLLVRKHVDPVGLGGRVVERLDLPPVMKQQSGGAQRNAQQSAFDSMVSPGNPARATLNGQPILITNVLPVARA